MSSGWYLPERGIPGRATRGRRHIDLSHWPQCQAQGKVNPWPDAHRPARATFAMPRSVKAP